MNTLYNSLAKSIERIVTKENKKKYYRFRSTRFYGGIATADTVGCNLRCKFCWSTNSVWNPKNTGSYYSPNEVAEKLIDIALSNGFNQMRISGGEPTIGRQHLIGVLENISTDFLFILETNGILLGADRTYVHELNSFKNLHVRVSIKGCSPDEFFWLTGFKDGFSYQMKALENLKDENINFNIALVSVKKDKNKFFNILDKMNLEKILIEEEIIKLYPKVRKRLANEGMLNYFEGKY